MRAGGIFPPTASQRSTTSSDHLLRSKHAAFRWQRNANPTHAGGYGGVDAHLRVLEYQAPFWRDAETLGGHQKWLGIRLTFGIVARADERREPLQQTGRP